MTSYYIDGALASLITLMVMAAASMVFRPARFNHGDPCLVGLLGDCNEVHCSALRSCRGLRRDRNPGCSSGGSMKRGTCPERFRQTPPGWWLRFSLGVLVLGHSPSITYIRQGLQPLYPVLGQGKSRFPE